MRSLRMLMTIALVGAGLGFAPVPASADHNTCGSGHRFEQVVATTGTVDPVDQVDFWSEGTVAGPETLRLIALKPVNGDADLYVWSADCSTLLCLSRYSGDTIDTCTVDVSGGTNVEVGYYAGGSVQYTLNVAYSPLFID